MLPKHRCAKVADEFVSSGENKDNWTITRDVLAHDIANAIRSRWQRGGQK